MASPVTSENFGEYSQITDVCERLTALIGGFDQVKILLDYLFDPDTGEFTQAVRSIGLLPPGVIVAYHTATTDFDSAKTEVEKLGRTQADIDSGSAPFWRVCDGLNGTPDLGSRVIVGARKTADTALALSQRTVSDVGGVETVTLTFDQAPDHDHLSGYYSETNGTGSDFGAGDMRFPSISEQALDGAIQTRELHTTSNGGTIGTTMSAMNIKTLGVFSAAEDEAADAHENMPPFRVQYYIIRTSRVF